MATTNVIAPTSTTTTVSSTIPIIYAATIVITNGDAIYITSGSCTTTTWLACFASRWVKLSPISPGIVGEILRHLQLDLNLMIKCHSALKLDNTISDLTIALDLFRLNPRSNMEMVRNQTSASALPRRGTGVFHADPRLACFMLDHILELQIINLARTAT
ncbi:hypothetical protein RIF29_28662 [Crotalaria pallida]|uniref:Uncharacterized protein n=1 Tax=Crotalaria pallida TaxID=3830 RepID=A0AAN9EIB9_CROPI